jgi:hypothetical protein
VLSYAAPRHSLSTSLSCTLIPYPRISGPYIDRAFPNFIIRLLTLRLWYVARAGKTSRRDCRRDPGGEAGRGKANIGGGVPAQCIVVLVEEPDSEDTARLVGLDCVGSR